MARAYSPEQRNAGRAHAGLCGLCHASSEYDLWTEQQLVILHRVRKKGATTFLHLTFPNIDLLKKFLSPTDLAVML